MLGVGEGVGVGVGVEETVGVGVGVGETVGVGVGVGETVGVGVGVGETVGVGVGVGETVGVGFGVGVSVGFGVGFTATFTPLLQTSFLPDLIQVNLNPLTVEVEFNFVQVPPALAVASNAIFAGNRKAKTSITRAGASRRIEREYMMYSQKKDKEVLIQNEFFSYF